MHLSLFTSASSERSGHWSVRFRVTVEQNTISLAGTDIKIVLY